MAIRGRRQPFAPIIKTRIQTAAPALQPPIGRVVTAIGFLASQAAVDHARHRLLLPVIIKTRQKYSPAAAGPPIGRIVIPFGRLAAQAASNREHHPLLPVIINTPPILRVPGSGAATSFLERVPDPEGDPRRMSRHTEKIATVVNSLIRRGELVQLGPTEWSIPASGLVGPTGAAGADGLLYATPGGRLVLTSGSWDQTGQVTSSTVYYTPGELDGGGHDKIGLYSAGAWAIHSFAESSVAVPSTQWRCFDVFGYLSAGVLALETVNWSQRTGSVTAATNASPIQITSVAHGLVTNDTVFMSGGVGNTGFNGGAWAVTRIDADNFTLQASVGNGAWVSGGTWWQLNGARTVALALQNNVLVKSSDVTRRYLGTCCTNGTVGQTEDSRSNALVSNAYNKTDHILNAQSPGGHTYSTNYVRYNGNDPTIHAKFVLGLPQQFPYGLFGQLTGDGITGRAQTKTAQDGVTANQDNIVVTTGVAVNCSTFSFAPNCWSAGLHFLPLHENSPNAVAVIIGISGLRIDILQ